MCDTAGAAAQAKATKAAMRPILDCNYQSFLVCRHVGNGVRVKRARWTLDLMVLLDVVIVVVFFVYGIVLWSFVFFLVND